MAATKASLKSFNTLNTRKIQAHNREREAVKRANQPSPSWNDWFSMIGKAVVLLAIVCFLKYNL